MTMKKISKLTNDLENLQKKCSARLMGKKDIENAITALQHEREKILTDKLGRKYLKTVHYSKSFAIPNAYKYRAETTYIIGSITKYGKIELKVGRSYASRVPYGGIIEKLTPIFA